ncbi:MAG: hypothetical protein KGS61_18520, partial [Verrucomicrobia bacterium]|nr:hypothetical protein [Verrucomicrobiota bacterium]
KSLPMVMVWIKVKVLNLLDTTESEVAAVVNPSSTKSNHTRGVFQKPVEIILGVNRMSQRPRRVKQTPLRQPVNGHHRDAQIKCRFSPLEPFFLKVDFRMVLATGAAGHLVL